MRVLWINRASDNLTVNSTELLNPVTESNDLCWTNKCARKQKKKLNQFEITWLKIELPWFSWKMIFSVLTVFTEPGIWLTLNIPEFSLTKNSGKKYFTSCLSVSLSSFFLYNFHKLEFKGVLSRFAHVEKCCINFSILSFVIRVNLLHP